jgi:hypothetical protein
LPESCVKFDNTFESLRLVQDSGFKARILRTMEENMSIDEYSLAFDGEMLIRGFWLQVWAVGYNGQQYVYIDHTADNVWANAPSPVSGLSLHFDPSRHAPENSLTSCLQMADISPQACHFRMMALGPVFKEQLTIHKHEPLRSQLETLAYELAAYLQWRGFEVLGNYQKGDSVAEPLLDEIKSKVMAFISA